MAAERRKFQFACECGSERDLALAGKLWLNQMRCPAGFTLWRPGEVGCLLGPRVVRTAEHRARAVVCGLTGEYGGRFCVGFGWIFRRRICGCRRVIKWTAEPFRLF